MCFHQIPEGDWICPGCNAQASDSFCFKEGEDCTLPEFEAIASRFKKEYMENLAVRLDKKVEDIVWQDMERDFWQVVESGDEPVEVSFSKSGCRCIYCHLLPVLHWPLKLQCLNRRSSMEQIWIRATMVAVSRLI